LDLDPALLRILHGRFKESEVWSVCVSPIAQASGCFIQYVEFHELFYQLVRSHEARFQMFFHQSNTNDRLRSGFGNTEPIPSSLPSDRSASESKRVNSASIDTGGLGGNSAGMNALYPAPCFTYFPARKIRTSFLSG
jgi:hypothetical protein